VRSRSRVQVEQLGEVRPAGRGRAVAVLAVPVLSLLIPALAVAIASAGGDSEPARISAAVARFLLYYSGVFALLALSAAVAAGLLATDRTVISPEHRILAQALHRTASLIGISALANHIMLEVLAHRARIVDGFVPFMAARNTFYMGLGTVASDLFIMIIVTGLVRRRFSSRRMLWRALHATAYAAWPLAILHGLLAGRSAKPYVDWSYGGCLAAVGLALLLRYVMIVRGRNAAVGLPARPRSSPLPATALDPATVLDRATVLGRGTVLDPAMGLGYPAASRRPPRAALPAAPALAPLPEPRSAGDRLPPSWHAVGGYQGR
jgi:hypothetical protein